MPEASKDLVRSQIATAARPAEGSGVGNTLNRLCSKRGCRQYGQTYSDLSPIPSAHSSRNTKKPPEVSLRGPKRSHMGRGHYRPPRRRLDLAETAWHLAGGDLSCAYRFTAPPQRATTVFAPLWGVTDHASVDHEVVIAAFDGSFAQRSCRHCSWCRRLGTTHRCRFAKALLLEPPMAEASAPFGERPGAVVTAN